MIEYELTRRIFRSLLGHDLKGEVCLGEISSSMPINLDILSPISIIASINHPDSSCETFLEDKAGNSEESFSLLLDQLRNDQWIEISNDEMESRKSFFDPKNKWLFSIKAFKDEETLYWLSLRKYTSSDFNVFQVPQILQPETQNALLLPNTDFDFKFSSRTIHDSATNVSLNNISILKTDLSILQLSLEYNHQLYQSGWRLSCETATDFFHTSKWIHKLQDNDIQCLILGINSLDINDDYIVTIFINSINRNNYACFLNQVDTSQSKVESISTELVQKIAKIVREDMASIEFVPENIISEYMPMPLPSNSEVIGSALIDDRAIKVFANFPLSGLQSYSYVTEAFQSLGWEPLSVPFRSGKGFIDSGFDFRLPRFFFWPNAENGQRQISIRTFPLSSQWTDVEIDCRPKIFETVPHDFNELSSMYLDYPIIPSFEPQGSSFTENTGEALNHGLYYSQARVQSAAEIEVLIAHYTEQLSNSDAWGAISNSRNERLFTSIWSAEDSQNRIWTGIFSLTGIEEDLQGYLLQFIALDNNQSENGKQQQGIFKKLMNRWS
jgi:hypothetical protein